MGKHGTGHGKQHTTLPPPKGTHRPHKPDPRRPVMKPRPTVVPPEPTPPPPAPSSPSTLEHAAHRVLSATSQILGHLEHAPGCPFGGGGPCTCGYSELVAALGALRTALSAS